MAINFTKAAAVAAPAHSSMGVTLQIQDIKTADDLPAAFDAGLGCRRAAGAARASIIGGNLGIDPDASLVAAH
jgi:hypothetical protein